ncbi:MAG: 4-hydroxy-3-methylbut-2-en-1-yl diphosphate synthase [Chlamydiae bacterium RIFCSPHIGHO2_12_FULL_44_59]|nr:MAG: 4-hydroxy-3-methylbut-2-en-1-yl diphosphate synthase [Chlamydiae bacterium RIFCSPHIGHO2_01_FULL_44_39]OGN58717.1 MAG: 4-hydroxy-3-methylbut-2-en-1-yl diphosphate synthase [Chlamydiae bacterium RIFCSPHIGHO2_02_FULL_45_9]OGN59896.1 MAG: 4-hydroxy-3-methylbut-2-en-1-yl diphosphate synthase [Chlamydiae bacterium RIFCSPHIGHO2_12_FULL_44_59]OGN66103.1 MAG: 4-hydroxy-3-methylbut-2-en-1-yl diphosphate synthase [Chlamydiae bacterium RIFCSPLOWO2_01_FULL_44_52]OGN68638.1 MAG: 4-hydroxy-3-methylbut
MKYCASVYQTKRFRTREIRVGHLGIGGRNPIRIQSMTTSNTRDIEATLQQITRLTDEGCEMVRVTVQGKKEAESCGIIKNRLVQKGYSIPLVADIHFYPPAALLVAEYVDKVRINPGNFIDKRASFRVLEYDESSYLQELRKIEEGFSPLVEKCKRFQRAMRIGTNHGSLSDRIMNRYGDTPRGMVESALEFANVCRKYDYHEFCFSMKSSNPVVMIHAYRLLVAEMIERGWDYPLHLGVTEAGEGEDGRLKSAMGIGALLLDGLGDTIRVSLTEDPWKEIEPCKRLVRFAEEKWNSGIEPFEETLRDFRGLTKRNVLYRKPFHEKGSVVVKKGEGEYFIEGERLKEEDCILFRPKQSPVHEVRKLVETLKIANNTLPLIVELEDHSKEERSLRTGSEFGAILCDGLAEGVVVHEELFGLSILQAARMRMSKTDFISCPGCGRTLFDLQEVSRKIRNKTAHLPGVKIAIMGCIVNGPGEMADADFGYVGSLPGKVDLYVGKECVQKHVDFAVAEERLIALIQSHGAWINPIH